MTQFIQRDRKVEASSKLIIIYGIYGIYGHQTYVLSFFSSRERLKDGTCHSNIAIRLPATNERIYRPNLDFLLTLAMATNMGPLRDVYDLI